jgi:hypothetical protein
MDELFKSKRWTEYQDVEPLNITVPRTDEDEKKIEDFRKFIDIKEQKDERIINLQDRVLSLTDGLQCFYNDIEFYIDPFSKNDIKVYYNGETYKFNNFVELVNYPLFDSKTIYDCILEITW